MLACFMLRRRKMSCYILGTSKTDDQSFVLQKFRIQMLIMLCEWISYQALKFEGAVVFTVSEWFHKSESLMSGYKPKYVSWLCWLPPTSYSCPRAQATPLDQSDFCDCLILSCLCKLHVICAGSKHHFKYVQPREREKKASSHRSTLPGPPREYQYQYLEQGNMHSIIEWPTNATFKMVSIVSVT